MTERARPPIPRTLLGAAVLVGLQGLLLVGVAVLELANLHADRVALALTTALFFVGLGTGMLFCARGLLRLRSWARGPVVAVELIGVLLSFSFWGGETTPGAVVIGLMSVATLVAVLAPSSTRALAADDVA